MRPDELSPDLSPEATDITPPLSAAYPELEKLKAANEALREQGKEWLLTTLETIAEEFNHSAAPPPVSDEASGEASADPPVEPTLQIGGQDWEFEVDKNVMVGERLGIRHRGQTLLVEVGWPRTQEHGIVPDMGLARARVSLSPNIMIDAILLDELTLRREKDGASTGWYVFAERTLKERVTEEKLRVYLQRVLAE